MSNKGSIKSVSIDVRNERGRVNLGALGNGDRGEVEEKKASPLAIRLVGNTAPPCISSCFALLRMYETAIHLHIIVCRPYTEACDVLEQCHSDHFLWGSQYLAVTSA